MPFNFDFILKIDETPLYNHLPELAILSVTTVLLMNAIFLLSGDQEGVLIDP